MLHQRESQRQNNISSRILQHHVNTETDQISDSAHQGTHKSYPDHKLQAADTNLGGSHKLNKGWGTVEATIGPDRQNIPRYAKTQSYHADTHTHTNHTEH